MENQIKWLIIHHEAGNNGFESVNEYHRQKWNFKSSLGYYIAYQYYIDKSGRIYQGRADTDEGIHCKSMNKSSIGICLQGNFSQELPTENQKRALEVLMSELCNKYSIPLKRIVPHRFFRNTECYGKLITDNWARDLIDSTENVRIELLKKQIGIIEQLIKVYVKLLNFFKRSK